MQAGAVAAIVYNNVAETSNSRSWTLQNDRDPPWIPSFSISQADGLEILSVLPFNGNVKYYFPITDNSWEAFYGTSMASPIVAGAVAFAALNFPNESTSERKNRIMQSVDSKSYLTDKVYSGGSLNLRKIIDLDNNYIPDWWDNTTSFISPVLSDVKINDQDILSFDFLAHNNRIFSFEYTNSLETSIWNANNPIFLGEGYKMRAEIDLSQEEMSQSKKGFYRLIVEENN